MVAHNMSTENSRPDVSNNGWNKEWYELKGDPKIYELLEKSELFPKKHIYHFDCIARAFVAAHYMFRMDGELSEIHNVAMTGGDFQTYWIYKGKPYCYPITWHDKTFPELSVDEIKKYSFAGELSMRMFADMWLSITRDPKITRVMNKYARPVPPYQYGVLRVYDETIENSALMKYVDYFTRRFSIYKRRNKLPDKTPNEKRYPKLLSSYLKYILKDATRDDWSSEGIAALTSLIDDHHERYGLVE